jgi:ProP effector
MNLKSAYASIELLASNWPQCFAVKFADRKPLKIGIGREVAAATAGAITPAELEMAFQLYTSQPGYLTKLKEGAMRVDLAGRPAGVVTADEAAHAQRRVERIVARASSRTRARGLAIEEATIKAKTEAEEAKRAAEVAAGTRKPVLRLPQSRAA